MSESCDLCGRDALEPVYQPQVTTHQKVHLCTHCGLLQTLPRQTAAPKSHSDIPAAAHTGKSLRAENNLTLIEKHIDLDVPFHVLDVGARSGTFSDFILRASPRTRVTAIESDRRLAARYKDRPRLSLSADSADQTSLPDESVDLVYSCYALHQLASPRRALAEHWRLLKPSGHLFLEVPNLALIGDADIVEEWFADENLYHYSQTTLVRLLRLAGFKIIDGPVSDRVNLTVVAMKAPVGDEPVSALKRNVEAAAALVATYKATRERNLRAMKAVARRIEAMATDRVVVWGAGRLFDCLLSHGELDRSRLLAVADRHLARAEADASGMRVIPPDALKTLKPGAIIVMSRSFADEIAAEAKTIAPSAAILTLETLLADAGNSAAASA